jgi:hypothetical protein
MKVFIYSGIALAVSAACGDSAVASAQPAPPPAQSGAPPPAPPAQPPVQPPPAQPAPPPGYYYPAPAYRPAYVPPAERPPEEPKKSEGPPPPNEGFQMALRLGAGVPFGNATGEAGDSQRTRYSTQAAFEIALGGKPSAHVYLGAYAGVWGGGEGSDEYTGGLCADGGNTNVDCSSASARLGAEVQYHFLPSESVNPWIGYGLAYEWAWESINDHVAYRTEDSNVQGFQFGRIQGGIDFRLGKVLAIGPYLCVELGTYTRASTEIDGTQVHSGGIERKAVHGWFGSGARLVFFP